MRLTNYLTEESRTYINNYNQLVGLIRKNCKQYIKEVNSGNDKRIFLREVTPEIQTFGYLQSLRSNRRPVDIDLEIHNILDDWMFQKFGIRGRSNAWFVWSARNSYNKAFSDFLFAFPYNGYKYLFNPYVNDVYAKLKKSDYLSDEWAAENFIELYGKSYTTKGALTKPTTLRVEVMLQAPKCLFVNSEAVNKQSLYGIENPTDFWKDIGVTKF